MVPGFRELSNLSKILAICQVWFKSMKILESLSSKLTYVRSIDFAYFGTPSKQLRLIYTSKFHQTLSIFVRVLGLRISTNYVPADLLMQYGFR